MTERLLMSYNLYDIDQARNCLFGLPDDRLSYQLLHVYNHFIYYLCIL